MYLFVLCAVENLSAKYVTIIQPFWLDKVLHGTLEGLGKVDIAYAYVLNAQATGSIVISSGRIESLIKYKEIIYDLYEDNSIR